MKWKIAFLLIAFIGLSCAIIPTPVTQSGATCGDGVCAGPESAEKCPQDCRTNPAPSATAAQSNAGAPEKTNSSGDAPLYFTSMTHMEGGWSDDKDEDLFLRHVAQLRYGMSLAEEYGALLTVESEKPFARANSIWSLNIMAEVRDRGFGVGTHCDIGYNEPLMPVDDFADLFRINKKLVDDLIGAENNLGCSGGGSVNDWANAASQAGFKYLDGIVSMHFLSMPIENRPGPEWTNEYIHSGHHHLNAPADFWQRIYLFGVSDSKDFVADPNPVIVISSGEMGLISAIAEQGREIGHEALQDEDYVFDNADIDALVKKILEADAGRDRSRVAKICVFLPASIFEAENEPVLRYFFEQIRNLEARGVTHWATQRQVYEEYVSRGK